MSGERVRGWCGGGLLALATVACEADMAEPPPVAATDAPESDSAALAALYHATAGPDWRWDANWLTFDPLEDWYGVTADSQNRATRLVLPRNNLNGPLPPELGNLSRLEHLDLEGWENYLTGPIPPEMGNLRALNSDPARRPGFGRFRRG